MDEQTHKDCYHAVIEAHQRVVSRWREQHPVKLDHLESITKHHTQDALYRPFDCCWDVEQQFYAEMDAVMDGVRWPFDDS